MAIGDVYDAAPDGVSYVDPGLFETPNYGSIYVVESREPALVDTGMGTNYERILSGMADRGVAPEALEHVLLTHVHLDHAGGAGYLLEECPNATVHVHEAGAPHLIDPGRLIEGTKAAVGDQWRFYADPVPLPEDRVETLSDGDAVDLGDRTLEAVAAPGHAPHQVTYHDLRTGALFTGDAAGIYVPQLEEIRETSPPPNFDLDQCLADVRTIEGIAPETLCFGHFGDLAYDPDAMEGYKRTLVEWVEAVRRRREEFGDDQAVMEHFVEHADDFREIWDETRVEGETKVNVRGVLVFLDRRE